MQESERTGSLPTKHGVTRDQLLRIHLVVEEVRAELKDVIHLPDVWVKITFTDTMGKQRTFYEEKV